MLLVEGTSDFLKSAERALVRRNIEVYTPVRIAIFLDQSSNLFPTSFGLHDPCFSESDLRISNATVGVGIHVSLTLSMPH